MIYIAILSFFIFLTLVGLVLFLFVFKKPNYFKQAEEYRNAALYDRAIELYLKELEVNPKSIETHLALANIYLEKKHYDMAKEELEEILKIMEETKKYQYEKEVIFKLVEVYNDLNMKTNEYLFLLKAVHLDKENIKFRLKLVDFMIGNGKIEEALSILNDVLELEPINVEALFRKGVLLLNRKPEEGIETLEALLKINTQYVPAYEILGHVYLNQDINKAIKYFQITRGLTKDLLTRANASVMLAYLYSLSKNWKKIVLELEPLLSFTEKFSMELLSEIYFALGLAYMFLGNEEKSDEFWRMLVKVNFEFMDIYEVFQLKRNTSSGRKKILDYWNNYFAKKSFQNPLNELVVYKIRNIEDVDEKFREWLLKRGEGKGVKKEKKASKFDVEKVKVKNHVELAQLPIYQFKLVMRDVLKKMNYIVNKELESEEGFDAIIVKNIGDVPIYMVGRNWMGQIGEIPINQMISEMEKMDYRRGMLICCGEFSEGAKKLAEDNKIKLIGASLLDRILRQL